MDRNYEDTFFAILKENPSIADDTTFQKFPCSPMDHALFIMQSEQEIATIFSSMLNAY